MHELCGVCNPFTEERAQAALQRAMEQRANDPVVLADRARARREVEAARALRAIEDQRKTLIKDEDGRLRVQYQKPPLH